MKSTYFETLILNRIEKSKLPLPEKEYQFCLPRKFRFDFAWPDLKIAIEAEGGVWIRGGHVRGTGYIQNCKKYNMATLLGWRVLRYTPDMIDDVIDDLKVMIRSCHDKTC